MNQAIQSIRPQPVTEPDFLREQVEAYGKRVTSWGGGHIMHGREPGAEAVMLVSNDYLDLANDPEITAAQVEALRANDNTMLMSAVYLHGESPQLEFEARMARWMRTEASVLCQSGYAANVGLVQAIGKPGLPVYIDMFAHASLWDGIVSGGMVPRPFRHNDADHLESQIKRHGRGIVLVDSIYSIKGSVAPLKEMVALANRHDCVIVVDESHSLGTHGDTGRGLVASLGLSSQVHFVTASLAKAFAGRAGIIACSKRLQEFVKYHSFPAIFSSALLPHEIAGLSSTLDVIKAADDKRKRLHANADYLRTQIDRLGYNIDCTTTQIIPLEAGPENQTMVLRDALEARGVFGSVFCAPATATKRSLIRFSVSAGHSREQLRHVVAVCDQIRDEVDLANWPSTRRKQRTLKTAA
jgi:CAI-1 autoinducer synthase